MSEMKHEAANQEWKRDRMRRGARMRSRNSSLFVGIFFISLGAAWTLQNLGVFRVRDVFDFWPLLPIAWGIQAILRGKSVLTYAIGGLAIGLGALKLLDNLDIFYLSSRYYAPIILITLGVGFLARNFSGGEGNLAEGESLNTPLIHPFAIFGGVKRNVDSQEFEGGEAAAIFGGVDLNMRRARIKGDTATIEANAIFGGVHLRVPENWKVEVRGVAIFGGYEDKTLSPQAVEGAPVQRLVLTGNAIFGGVEIEN